MTAQPQRHFQDELDRLKERVLHMSGVAERAVAAAVEAFLTRDERAARTVTHGDYEIDRLEVEIGEMVTQLIALHQPVARDLRLILATLKITNDLERVGDHAVNIAQSARTLSTLGNLDSGTELVEMSRRVRQMLSSALTAFVKADGQLGREVCRQDDQVDDLHKMTFKVLIAEMTANPSIIDGAMELMRVSRNLERIADLATNIAEDVVFFVEGTDIKHHGAAAAGPRQDLEETDGD